MTPPSMFGPQRQVIQGAFAPQSRRWVAQAVQCSANGEVAQLPPHLTHFGRAAGQPLPGAVLQKMESFFDATFQDVRVHVGPEASSLGAMAFTYGSHLYFAPGQYNPTTHRGQEILAHELTHVLQQRAGRVRNPFGSGVAVVQDRGMEAEAERMGRQAAAHRSPPAQVVPAPRLPLPGPAPGRATGTVQPLSFGRFSSWGFLSNWGSYNRTENALLALVAEVYSDYSNLDRKAKARGGVISLKRQLDQIDGSTLADTQYASTRTALLRIQSKLDQERRAQYLLERGYPESPILTGVADPEFDPYAWVSIVTTIPKRLRKELQKGKRPRGLIENLFKSFCSQRFRYNIMASSITGLLTSSRGPNPEGNCLALARGFAEVLNAYDIEAEARHVRDEDQGRFIVKLNDFIDPNVRGHIYYKKTLQAGYYMFTNHAATWVPSKNLFFDPMAKASYTVSGFKRAVDCEIEEAKDHIVFTPKGKPKTLQPGFKWRLIKKEKVLRGNFNEMELRPVKKPKRQY